MHRNIFGVPRKVNYNTYRVSVSREAHIDEVVVEAIAEAKTLKANVQFEHLGVTFEVNEHSDEGEVYELWKMAHSRQ